MGLIGSYMNGNYKVSIYEDGTKVRENDLDYFEPDTVESMDIKITNKCNKGCPMCHEDSKPDGKHADLLSPCFIDKLHLRKDTDRKYTGKAQYKRMKQLTYHHILEKSKGRKSNS